MPSYNFLYQSRSARVVFGAGSLQSLVDELNALGVHRALVLCTKDQQPIAQRVAELLADRCAGVFNGAVMHVPIEAASAARNRAGELGADCAVAIGGGSTIGLAKAIALESGLPIIAVPTTYAGSEMTPIYGITQGGLKRTGTDARVLPRTVVYDPMLTLSLPVELSITSGLNAIAHAAEGLYSRDANPISSLMAEEGIRALGAALPKIRMHPQGLEGRSNALYGAWLCGTVLGSVGMALHHKLCHTLGGSFNLEHAAVHSVVLPHALAYNATSAPDAMSRIARALDAPNAPQAIFELAKANGAPIALRSIGMEEADLDLAADIASRNPYWNPKPIERQAVRALLQDAFEGAPPRCS